MFAREPRKLSVNSAVTNVNDSVAHWPPVCVNWTFGGCRHTQTFDGFQFSVQTGQNDKTLWKSPLFYPACSSSSGHIINIIGGCTILTIIS